MNFKKVKKANGQSVKQNEIWISALTYSLGQTPLCKAPILQSIMTALA